MRFPYFGHGLDRGRAISGPAKDRGIEIGDRRYVIRAYCRRDEL